MKKTPSSKHAPKSGGRPVVFRVNLPDAREVIVTGDFTRWSTEEVRLVKGPGNEWTGTARLAPGDYPYRLLVDGEWRDDPAAEVRVPNSFGSSNCILRVSR